MRRLTSLILASTVAILTATAADARCTKLAFSVNDYGKEGPIRDAKANLDKYIARWTAERGIKKYTTGKKDVSCELYLDVGLFDEHTCKAEALVCWDGAAGAGSLPASGGAPAKAAPAKAAPAAKSGVAPAPAPALTTGSLKAAPVPAAATPAAMPIAAPVTPPAPVAPAATPVAPPAPVTPAATPVVAAPIAPPVPDTAPAAAPVAPPAPTAVENAKPQ